MSILSRILGGIGRVARSERGKTLISLVESLAKAATDRTGYRQALVKAAKAGDLDFVFDELNAAKREADDYIKNG